MSWQEAAVRWYAVLLVISVAWAPWLALFARRLPDRGVTLVRPLGLLATVYPGWLLAQVAGVPFGAPVLIGTLTVVAIAGWIALVRYQLASRRWLASLLLGEALAGATFAGYLWLRGFTPAIMNTEKPMEAAFLLSSQVTSSIPPPDPWFAGEPINYYYLGFLLHGSVARLADVPGTTAFNLALATTFSAAVVAAAGVGWNIARHWFPRPVAAMGAGLTVLLVLIVGNLYAASRFLARPAATIAAGWWDNAHGVSWRASRIVCDGTRVGNDCPDGMTINEFPSFSFILGDLHPHVLALPFTLAALSLAFGLVLLGQDVAAGGGPGRADWVRLIVTGAVLGSLYALNSWDFPTFFMIAALGLAWATHGMWRLAGVLALASIVPWLPFTLGYVPPASPVAELLPDWLRGVPILPRVFSLIAVHTGERTSVGEFLTIFGVPFVASLALLGHCLWQAPPDWRRARPELVAGALVAGLLAIVLNAPLLVLCGWPLLLAIVLLRGGAVAPRTIALGLVAVSLTLVLGTEFVYILDVFNSRMNTLFKVYYQVWTIMGAVSAFAVVILWQAAGRSIAGRVMLTGGVAASLLAGLISPVLSSRAWTREFSAWQGLDGIAYVASFSSDELAAIRWLQANVTPDDVILEAVGCSYQVNSGVPMGRAATFSGAPTVINWENHQRQWRAGQPDRIADLPRRQADVRAMFANPASPLVDAYGITLLYVGRYERENWQRECPAAGPYPGLEAPGYPGPGWEVAFAAGDVTIYRRDATVTRP